MNPSKKIMVRCDMEGLTGVVSYDQVIPGRAEYPYGCAMLKADLTALIEGLQAGGCDQIVLYDEHFDGRNIDMNWLPEGVVAICGKPPYRTDWAGGLDESFAGMILLGLHSRHGTPNGLLHHTYEHDICELELNGVVVGEIGMEAAIAGVFQVPLWMVVGDSAAITEVRALLPGVVGVAVKESVSTTGAVCYPLKQTASLIRTVAERLVKSPPPVKPFRPLPTPPRSQTTLRITFRDGAYLQALRKMCGDRMPDERRLVLEGASVLAVWAEYWQLKLDCMARAGLSSHGVVQL